MGSTKADTFMRGAKVSVLDAGVMIIKLDRHCLNTLSGTLAASSPTSDLSFSFAYFAYTPHSSRLSWCHS